MLAASEFLVLFELCSVLDKSALDLDLDRGFIFNGGDSLRAVALAAACKNHGLGLPRDKILRSQTLRSIFSTISCLADTEPAHVKGYLLSKLTSGVTELFDASTALNKTHSLDDPKQLSQWPPSGNTDHLLSVAEDRTETCDVPRSNTTSLTAGPVPLTEMQQLFIHGSLKQPGTNVIVHSETYETDKIPTLKDAWRQVTESETIFNQDFPNHREFHASTAGFNWVDLMSTRSTTEDQSEADAGIGSFFRVTPVNSTSSGPALSKVTWTVHHSLIDGYSASILFDKVLRIANGEPPLPPGPSFSQFTVELDRFRRANQELGNAYWASRQEDLNNAQHQLLLPPPANGLHENYAGSSTFAIGLTRIAQDIQLRSKTIGITPAGFYNAAWALTLAWYADSDLVSFGAVLCGRNLPIPGALDVIGPLLNTFPFLVRIDKSKTIEQFLLSTFDELVELEEYQWTSSENGFRRSFDTALSVELDFPDALDRNVRPLSRETRREHDVPLGVTIDQRGEVSFTYHIHRFSRENIQRLAESYRQALSLLLESDRQSTVDEVSRHLLSAANVEMLQYFGNCSSSTLTSSIEDDLVTLFEKRARELPKSVAIEKGCDSMTYQEMDKIASRVASRLLHEVKISPGEVVCVYSDRSMLWLCAMIGILKAGGTYCSMDPSVPQEVRNSIFGLSGAKAFITAKPCQLKIVPEGVHVAFTVQGTMELLEFKEGLEHRQIAKPHTPAYICFTSGSTGTPKGVICSHAGLVAFQSSLDVRLFAAQGRKIAHVMSVAFDGSIHEIFSALTHGATIVLPSGSDPFGHLHSVDSAILTPSLARLLDPEEFDRLKWVYFVGEPVPQAVCDRWASVKQLYNMYGPTEGTCGATIKRLLPRQTVTIGVPNATTRVYILTSGKMLAPPGAVGEVYLAGVQVAGGYLNLPQQTRDRFLPDTIWPLGAGEMMYKTGDRGYWTEDGEVALLGRSDREIKLRGFRLDMGDLEIRIARAYPSLQAVAVTVAQCERENQLIAMVQPQDTNIAHLREELGKSLPKYAMPQVIIATDSLPVTSAGKVDYKAVARASTFPNRPQKHEEPGPTRSDELATPTELVVAKAYCHVLELPSDVGVNASSNFNELGGHSLRQLELLRNLSATFGVQLSLRMTLAFQTVRSLAEAIDGCISHSSPTSVLGQRTAPASEERVTPIELEWVTKYQSSSSGLSSFNVFSSSTFDGSLVNQNRLIEAWNRVLSRHHLLSGAYAYQGTQNAVRVKLGCPPRVSTPCSIDLWREANRSFDLELEAPIRVFVTDNRLTVVLSHIVADYTALGILMREASDAYNGNPLEDHPPQSYSKANVWYEVPPQENLEFWSSYLRNCPENPSPFGPQPSRQDYSGTSALSIIDHGTFGNLLRYSASANVTLQQIAIACVAVCLDENSLTTDIVLGVPHINRATADDLDTFGLFLEPLPVRVTYDGAESQGSFMDAVKLSAQKALAHAVPWHRLLQHLGIKANYPNHPIFDVMVTMHDFRHSNDLEMKIPGFRPSFAWSEGAKFKLLCEFTALPGGKLLLRTEYDSAVVPEKEIERLHQMIPAAIRMISVGAGHEQLKRSLRDVTNDNTGDSRILDTNCIFGKSLLDV